MSKLSIRAANAIQNALGEPDPEGLTATQLRMRLRKRAKEEGAPDVATLLLRRKNCGLRTVREILEAMGERYLCVCRVCGRQMTPPK